ncbi:MAG: hypothetical protein V1718_02880 [archaeon]
MKAIVFIKGFYNISGIGPLLTATVKEGILKTGMSINISGRIMAVQSIEIEYQDIKESKPGDNIAITLKNADSDLLKQIVNSDMTFTDEPSAQASQLPKPNHPKGAFSFLTGIFKKKN